MLDTEVLVDAVAEHLRSTLLRYAQVLPPSLVSMGKVALSAPGKALFVPQTDQEDGRTARELPRWPLSVILSYRAAAHPEQRDCWREALPAAVAVEIAVAAADLLDEIADEDPSLIVDRYGEAQAANTANLMLVMAQQILAWDAREREDGRSLAALVALQEMLVEAAVGQHLEMAYQGMGIAEVTPEMAADATSKKAGALIGGACRIGALMAGAGEDVVDLLSRFGREIGGIAQIVNDLQDVLPGRSPGVERKTDLRMRKRTLPIVFALRDESPEPNPVQGAFAARNVQIDEEAVRQAVVDAGGVQFANLVMELHQQNAQQALEELEALRPGAREVLAPLVQGLPAQ